MPDVTVLLPCLNEAASLPGVLAAMPNGYRALVIDNNSTDGTAEVARRHGAEVVAEQRPGYGSAVHAGVVAAKTPIVAVIDADGSLDARELPALAVPSTGCNGRGMRGWAPPRCVGGFAPATDCPCMTSLRCGWRTATRCWHWA